MKVLDPSAGMSSPSDLRSKRDSFVVPQGLPKLTAVLPPGLNPITEKKDGVSPAQGFSKLRRPSSASGLRSKFTTMSTVQPLKESPQEKKDPFESVMSCDMIDIYVLGSVKPISQKVTKSSVLPNSTDAKFVVKGSTTIIRRAGSTNVPTVTVSFKDAMGLAVGDSIMLSSKHVKESKTSSNTQHKFVMEYSISTTIFVGVSMEITDRPSEGANQHSSEVAVTATLAVMNLPKMPRRALVRSKSANQLLIEKKQKRTFRLADGPATGQGQSASATPTPMSKMISSKNLLGAAGADLNVKTWSTPDQNKKLDETAPALMLVQQTKELWDKKGGSQPQSACDKPKQLTKQAKSPAMHGGTLGALQFAWPRLMSLEMFEPNCLFKGMYNVEKVEHLVQVWTKYKWGDSINCEMTSGLDSKGNKRKGVLYYNGVAFLFNVDGQAAVQIKPSNVEMLRIHTKNIPNNP